VGTVPYTPGTGEVHTRLGQIWRTTSANLLRSGCPDSRPAWFDHGKRAWDSITMLGYESGEDSGFRFRCDAGQAEMGRDLAFHTLVANESHPASVGDG
jgi:hypothetical protein